MMLTSADRSNDLSRCQELNISAYLVKPVKQSELLDSIVQAVGVNTAFAGSAVSPSAPGRTASVAKSILLAEDSLINQKLAIGLLERWGHRVTVASNGNEAVRLSGNEEFDLILMDVQMPELDGLDATREIRKREEKSGIHLPIIAMTAHAMKGDRELCLAAGMDGYLMKPIRAEQLFRQIEDATDDRLPAEPREKNQVDQINGLVNWTVANRAVNGDSELLKQVIAAFLSEGPQLLSTLEHAYAENDGKRFQRAAHTLKSALRTFGVDNCNAAEELELAAKNGLSTIEPTRIAAVVAQVQPVFLEMEHHLRTNSANGTIR
jgi:two-component system sensor histidine kinase/response regulator